MNSALAMTAPWFRGASGWTLPRMVPIFLAACAGARAQTASGPPPTGPSQVGAADAYGNAQSDLPERRTLGIFDRVDWWEQPLSHSTLGQPQRSRGDAAIFSLPGDILGLRTMQTLTQTASPSVMANVSPQQRAAISRYGGFGDRRKPPDEDIVGSALSRKFNLMAATSRYAPVYRAIAQRGSLLALRTSVLRTPFDAAGVPEAADGEAPLDVRLAGDVEAAMKQALGRAWERFSGEEYRLAARAFEAVLTLDPDNAEARIGGLLCQAATGSAATSVVVAAELARRVSNPFVLDPRAADHFATEKALLPMLLEARVRVESAAAAENPALRATYALVLWYLGEREEAIRAVEAAVRSRGGVEFAAWPAQMRAAVPAADPPTPTGG